MHELIGMHGCFFLNNYDMYEPFYKWPGANGAAENQAEKGKTNSQPVAFGEIGLLNSDTVPVIFLNQQG